jgi:hypothetical protein
MHPELQGEAGVFKQAQDKALRLFLPFFRYLEVTSQRCFSSILALNIYKTIETFIYYSPALTLIPAYLGAYAIFRKKGWAEDLILANSPYQPI